ncbi:MAG: recombinase family protein [Candidatus Omnitrophota bacterium]
MNVGIYIRVSTEDQVKKFSIPAQQKILISLAEKNSWNYTLFIEKGISGEKVENRPEIQRLFKEIEAGKINMIAVIDIDRLSRSAEIFKIKEFLKRHNIQIATPNRTYDLRSEDDDFFSDILGSVSKLEKQKLLARTKRGIEEAKFSGKWLGGHPPDGYRFIHGKGLEIDEDRALIITQIFELAQTCSPQQIVNELNKKCILTQRNRYWGRTTLIRILKRELYTGRRNGIQLKIPVLIPHEQWIAVQQNLRKRLCYSDNKQSNLLSSLLECGYCGKKLHSWTTTKKDKKHRYYRCASIRREGTNQVKCAESKLIKMQNLDTLLIDDFFKICGDINKIIKGYKMILLVEDKAKKKQILKNELKSLELKKANLLQAIEKGLDWEEAKKRKDEIDRQIQNIEHQLSSDENKMMINLTDFKKYIKKIDLRKKFDSWGIKEKRRLLFLLFKKIVIYKDKIKIYYHFPIDSKVITYNRL